MKKTLLLFLFFPFIVNAQLRWVNADQQFSPLPVGIHVYYSSDSIDGKPNIAYYAEIDIKNRDLNFSAQVGNGKRYTPSQYYEKEGYPLVVVNSSFFEFVHNSNLGVVMSDKKLLAYNLKSLPLTGKDTFTYYHPYYSAIGIDKKRNADVAWTYTDSALHFPYAIQHAVMPQRDSVKQYQLTKKQLRKYGFKKWKMMVAAGGGPVILQDGEIKVSNQEERKFTGKAIDDKHPRTVMGYTKDGKLIILMIQGRFNGKAEGATLKQEAQICKDLGCVEAINLDGGGSSCMLINGKETIQPSDKEGQRPLPAVFMIRSRKQ
ncbi:MAG: hypothetical protein JWN76_3555 [Chitinophagaceae bacterium]|nr:hypothetical protein [Chitinophagaceae bacterium]